MTISLCVTTDGRRECLQRTLDSFWDKVKGNIGECVLIDDSANQDYATWLDRNFNRFRIVHHPTRRGFGASVQDAWNNLKPCRYVFHLEDDFVFRDRVELNLLMALLQHAPYLAQVVLKRTPVNDAEIRAGGFMELHPEHYQDKSWGGLNWVEHQQSFSTNPSLVRYEVTQLGFYTAERDNERLFGEKLNRYGYRYAYWGKTTDAPRVEHIGYQRVGNGY